MAVKNWVADRAAGKGDWQRPMAVSRKERDANYERIFGKKKAGEKRRSTANV